MGGIWARYICWEESTSENYNTPESSRQLHKQTNKEKKARRVERERYFIKQSIT